MGCRLHLHRWGTAGPLVLCLHSSGLSGFQWKRLADQVKEPTRFLAPDFLGYGSSPAPDPNRNFDLSEEIEEVVRLLDELAAPVILLGHSYGGFIALQSALRRSAQVIAIACYEPVIWGGLASARGVAIEEVVRRFDPELYLLDDSLAGTLVWMERFIDYWNGPGKWSSMSESQRRPMLALADKLFAEVKGVVLEPTAHTVYAALNQPVLLLHGTTSPPEVLSMKDILSEQLPNVATACIPGGHMNPVHNPLPVNAHFELFLRRQR